MIKQTPGPWFVDEANPNLIQTALIAKAEFEMRIFERVSKDIGQQLIDEVKRLQELIAKATGETNEQ